jgi:hypothetical protein
MKDFADIAGFSPEEQAALNYHRQNLMGGTDLKNQDGSMTTFMGTVVDTDQGSMVLPTYWHGEIRDVPQAMNFAIKSGLKFPMYPDTKSALAGEKRMHDIMDQDANIYRTRNQK